MDATARGRWGFWTLLALLALGFAACAGPAVFGTQHWNVGGLGGFIGAALGARIRNADFWRLDQTGRRQVGDAVLTGVPTGSVALDTIARARLERAVRGRSTANTVTAVVCGLITLALPVAASMRTGSRWYLVALVPTVLLVVVTVWIRQGREHPAERLRRFDGQPHPDSACSSS